MYQVLHCQNRQQSRLNKRHKLDSILAEGADLALWGQIFEWYRKIRRLCPKQYNRKIQFFDDHGMPLNPTQEIQAIERYYAELYLDASLPDFGRQPLTYLSFDCQDVRDALRDMPRMKDLAPDDFLAYIWKHFADDLAPYVRATFEYCWLGNEITPPPHWIVGWIHLLPKPNKVPSKPRALRPICLQHPVNKVAAGIQCRFIIRIAYSILCQFPFFAYMPHRGTRDYLLIIDHCRQVRDMCQTFRPRPDAPGLQGGLQVSLDMEKAFATVDRQLVLRALHHLHLNRTSLDL